MSIVMSLMWMFAFVSLRVSIFAVRSPFSFAFFVAIEAFASAPISAQMSV